jgi:predicted RNA-binding protein
MCEANAYIIRNGREEPIMENVDILQPEGDTLRLTSLFGEEKTVAGKIKSINLVDHKIIIEEL